MIRRLLVLTLLLATLPAVGQALDENERHMVEWIDAHAEDAIALLEETVNISSGTMNHAGVRDVEEIEHPFLIDAKTAQHHRTRGAVASNLDVPAECPARRQSG